MKGKRMPKGDFMKMILKMSLWQLTIFTVWQMVVFTLTGNEASTLIQWFFTFWGIEVCLLMIKKVMERYDRKKNVRGDDDE